MRKKEIYILILIFFIVLFIGCSNKNKRSMTGIYLKADNGENIILSGDNEAICMRNKIKDKDIFDDLSSGDKIEIFYGLISETYPAATDVYNCNLISKGNINDIPKEALEKLNEMGWEFQHSKK